MTYDPATDTMLVELRPWPGGTATDPLAGGFGKVDGHGHGSDFALTR